MSSPPCPVVGLRLFAAFAGAFAPAFHVGQPHLFDFGLAASQNAKLRHGSFHGHHLLSVYFFMKKLLSSFDYILAMIYQVCQGLVVLSTHIFSMIQ